ncbi:hypothetical protein [Frigoribacterium sp. UYMn621]|uniref:hypothetical protein n=1 Tax=Frigoribacterium sp. UYMn621 TaxID=3156343 RepID=UPI003392AF29
MTVNFTESHRVAPARLDLTELLLKTLRDKAGNPDPRAAVLRVLVRGLAHHVSPTAIKRWLVSLGTPEQVLCTTDGQWQQLVREAKVWLASSSSLSTARRMVARVVAPVMPGTFTSKRQEVQARVAVAVIGGQQLRTGYDKLLVTGDWLGLQLNLTPTAARTILKALERARWIRRVSSRGGALHYRLMKLGTEDLRDWADLHHDTIQALADGTPEDSYLATILMTAASPAWHYSDDIIAGGRTWLRLVLAYSGQPAGEWLGLSKRANTELRDELHRELPGALEGTVDLAAVLSVKSEETFAFFRHVERKDDLAALAIVNRTRVAAFREASAEKFAAKKFAGGLLHAAYDFAGRVPHGSDLAEVQRWTSQAAAYFNAGGGVVHDTALLPVLAGLLRELTSKAGWSDALIDKAVPFIIRETLPA